MKHAAAVVLGVLMGAFMVSGASAQQAVPPRWNWQGSAVCPEGFDFYAGDGLCISRGNGYGLRYGRTRYDEGVPPRWNRLGSAVCPEGYDFHAYAGLCLAQ